jgi:hypothetical protein
MLLEACLGRFSYRLLLRVGTRPLQQGGSAFAINDGDCEFQARFIGCITLCNLLNHSAVQIDCCLLAAA